MIGVLGRACSPLRAGSGPRCGAGGAYRRPCPLLPSPRCGGKKRELERSPSLFSASPDRGLARPSKSVRAARVSATFHRRRSCRTDCGLQFFLFFLNSTWLFGSRRGVQRGTNDAMSRRKLGSRPQHLSAIQGKPEGRQRHVGTLELFEGARERVVLCVKRKYTHRSALSH